MGANSHAQLKQLTTHSPCRRAWMATFNQSKAVPTAQKTVGGFLHGNDARQGVDDESRRSPIFVEKTVPSQPTRTGAVGAFVELVVIPRSFRRRFPEGRTLVRGLYHLCPGIRHRSLMEYQRVATTNSLPQNQQLRIARGKLSGI